MSDVQEIKVINHNPETLHGRYDGEDYVFLPEKPTCLSLDAAKHIFDLGKENKAQALNALGYFVPGERGMSYEEALKKLDNISFLTGRTIFEDEELALEPEPEQDAPAETPRRALRKTGGRPHVTGPGGEQGADTSTSAPANP